MTQAGAGRISQRLRRLGLGVVLWFIPAILFLATVVSALIVIQAKEDPADPSATVLEDCGSLVSPSTRKTATGQTDTYHARVCGHARSAELERTVQLLAAGAGTAALATVIHVRRGRRRAAPAAELQHSG